MKVFISWSGKQSQHAAKALREWLPCVINAVKLYVSSEDIEKGSRWGVEIAKELESSTYGILCLTAENLKSPWMHFEAGALARSLQVGRVSPILVGIKPTDVSGPLAQFQATSCRREEIWQLVAELNRALGSEATAEPILQKRFEMFWPNLDSALKRVGTMARSKRVAPRKTEDLLDEILGLLRDQQKLLRSPDGFSRLERAADALEQAQEELGFRSGVRVKPVKEEITETRYTDDRLNPHTTLRGRASSSSESDREDQ